MNYNILFALVALFLCCAPVSLAKSEPMSQQETDVNDLFSSYNLLLHKRQWSHPGTLDVISTPESIFAKLKEYERVAIPFLMNRMEKSKDHKERRACANMLQSFGEKVVSPVVQGLKNGTFDRFNAQWVLCKIPEAYAAMPLLLQATTEKEIADALVVTGSIAMESGAAAPASLVEAVLEKMKHDPSERNKLIAARTLCYMVPKERAVKELMDAIGRDGQGPTKSQFLSQLRLLTSADRKNMFPYYLKLAKGADQGLRYQARRILCEYPEKSALVIPVLVEVLKDPQRRNQALQLLPRFGEDAAPAVPFLISIIDENPESYSSHLALGLFQSIGLPFSNESKACFVRALQLYAEKESEKQSYDKAHPHQFGCATGYHPGIDNAPAFIGLVGLAKANAAIPYLSILRASSNAARADAAFLALASLGAANYPAYQSPAGAEPKQPASDAPAPWGYPQ